MKYIILLLLTAFTFVACESDSSQPDDQNRQTEVSASIFGINWILTELNGEPVSEVETSESIPTIQFDESENRLYGRGGCNQYNGGFELDAESGEADFSQIAATKMACPDMDLENLYFSMLNEVERMEQSSQILKFYNSSGETIALFESMEN
ncbi:META domain-containing protein [Rhodohalobacter sp.]|uniref:META domain-containing protein n=1 Tax=Rhodohalobacter sp. TaxID=1974210 RepID=UPI003567102D